MRLARRIFENRVISDRKAAALRVFRAKAIFFSLAQFVIAPSGENLFN